MISPWCNKDDDSKNSNPLPTAGCTGSTVTDIDGNTYNVVTIGNQCWMKQNLRTSKYRNGDIINNGLSNSSWQSTTSGAWAYYNDSSYHDQIYGKLYNWYAVADPRDLCPTGWRVSDENDWNTLALALDSLSDVSCISCAQSNIVGGEIKSIGTLQAGTGLWWSPNTGATNNSEFTALPGGIRFNNGVFFNRNVQGFWWSSTEINTDTAFVRDLTYNGSSFNRGFSEKHFGFSVRCIKD